MTTSEMFKLFLDNIKVTNSEQITNRYAEITSALNKQFRQTDSKTANTLQVGSYGRFTGIKGISDLDMLYIMPDCLWSKYKNNQTKLLTDVKDAIKLRYPNTKIKVDRLVVTVTYNNFHVEVQPVFEQQSSDLNYYKFPDTYNGGRWRETKPRHEMQEIKVLNEKKNRNLRLLCKIVRAWKNKHGVVMSGLLIDTLAYNFLKSTNDFDVKSLNSFDELSRNYFEYLSNQANQDHYKAPGSNQNVVVKKRFQQKAKKTHELCLKAIEAQGLNSVNDKWRKVYGYNFPSNKVLKESDSRTWRDTEEYIEDNFLVDIRYSIRIDCDVSQNGFRENTLKNMLLKRIPLLPKKNLMFKVVECDVPEPFLLKWKVLNCGPIAEERDSIRGQIVDDDGYLNKKESTKFRGEHIVECYAIIDDVVVARDSITVPIQ